jgi:D-galactarolactone cycloisomerase
VSGQTPPAHQSAPFSIRELAVFLFRAPADPPVQTSFGIMRTRPALLLRVTSAEDVQGWGEVWCNFPTVGAEHRARLAMACLRPLVCAREWQSPRQCFAALSEKLAVLALQSGEPGPLQQVVAGLDVALWDMVARRAGLPLWKLLSADVAERPLPVPVYASGINPSHPEQLAAAKLQEGYRAFKLKVGFGSARDDANLQAMREAIGADMPLMVDANQAWDLPQAIEAGRRMARHDLAWLEEPIRADAAPDQWAALAAAQPIALAGGENLAGMARFEAFIHAEGMSILQPDIGKWGGFSGCLDVGRAALRRGKRFCPHWLGGGIGLAASFHLKAAVGGAGYVEVDANPNPLRELLAKPAFRLAQGSVLLGEEPGLGVEPDLEACSRYRVPIAEPAA